MGSQKSAKEALLHELEARTELFTWEDMAPLTASDLALGLDVSRNLASQYLAEALQDNLVLKVNTRPVYFFHRTALQSRFGADLPAGVYASTGQLREELKRHARPKPAFEKVVGAHGSLRYCVEQCKGAITYPGNGLPVLLLGPTGSGKSLIAQTMFEYAVEKGVVGKDARFVVMNCSEYANNPELLLTNLFGHKKGAYTGADSDREGLLSLANDGVLFLDEVHNLKSECQEKLFLFMDKGTYHKVGDNDVWYSASVRLIFATTENPESTLLRTMLRRIPIVAQVPPMYARPLVEKKELVHYIFSQEARLVGGDISISSLAYYSMVDYLFPGDIGQMENCVRASIANALLERRPGESGVVVRVHNLPAYLRTSEAAQEHLNHYGDDEILSLEQLKNQGVASSPLLRFNQGLLAQDFTSMDARQALDACLKLLRPMLDQLLFHNRTGRDAKEEMTVSVLANIFRIVAKKFSIPGLSNNDVLCNARCLYEYEQNEAALLALQQMHEAGLRRLYDLFRDAWPVEFMIADSVSQLITTSFNISFGLLGILDMFFVLRASMREQNPNYTPSVIITHGFSTASSIAQAANHLLGAYVFGSIDVPVNARPGALTDALAQLFDQYKGCHEMLILVDMGSLEDIQKEDIFRVNNVNVGIINNVHTRLALDVGEMVLNRVPAKDIVAAAGSRHPHVCSYYENRQKTTAILAVCATGIGTAEKIASLLERSLPHKTSLHFVPVEFDALRTAHRAAAVLEKYDVPLIVGTLNPGLEGIPFVPVEAIVEQGGESLLGKVMENEFGADDFAQFSANLIRNFSLQNLLDYLTILNPDKVVAYVEEVMGSLEGELGQAFSSRIKMGLYIHISCLVERLVTERQCVAYEDLERFVRENKPFIELVKRCFAPLEKAYGVEMPVSEIGYLHDYLYRKPAAVSATEDAVSIFDER